MAIPFSRRKNSFSPFYSRLVPHRMNELEFNPSPTDGHQGAASPWGLQTGQRRRILRTLRFARGRLPLQDQFLTVALLASKDVCVRDFHR